MSFPRSDEVAKKLFKTLLPPDPRIQVRPMFGNIAAFVNGNLFAGLHGNGIFVRLPEEQQQQLLEEEGARVLAHFFSGRAMKAYVVVPEAWRQQPERIRPWIVRSLVWASGLAPKAPKKRR